MQTKTLDKKNIEDMLSLTPMQEGMLYFYLRNPQSDLYFEQLSLSLKGEIDTGVFNRAWAAVVSANEILRTLFRWEKLKHPTQVVLKEHTVDTRFHDLLKEKKSLSQVKAEDKKEKFDLRQVPFRVTLCKRAPASYEMIVSNHHILYDGWSNGIILNEFFTAYESLAAGKEYSIPRKTKFKEYVQFVLAQEQDRQRQEKYWKHYLAGFDTPTELPGKSMRRPGSDELATVGHFKTHIDEEQYSRIEGFCKAQKITTAAFLYTAWGILCQEYTGSRDVVFGTTVSGRNAKINGIEDMAGLFINTLPLRCQASGEKETVAALLAKINENLQIREGYETSSLVNIKEYSSLDSVQELFDSLMVIENYPLSAALTSQEEGKGRIAIENFSVSEMTNYDLTIAVMLTNKIEIDFIYNTVVLEENIIERCARHFINIVTGMIAAPGMEYSRIPILSEQELQQLLIDFNDHGVEFPNNKTIPQLFAEQVQRTPGNLALSGTTATGSAEVKSYTYEELDQAAARVAVYLQDKIKQAAAGKKKKKNNKDKKQGKLIAILADRTVEMIIGILGILKTGCGYVPLNPKAPASRNKYILSECEVEHILSGHEVAEVLSASGATAGKFETCDYIGELAHGHSDKESATGGGTAAVQSTCCDDQQGEAADCVAYIIFTSGSTGQPKGVPIRHRNFCPLMHWGYHHIKLGPQDNVVQNLSYYFDWSVWEIFIALTSGATLHMVTEDIMLNPEAYVDFLEQNQISVLHITPTQFQSLTDTRRQLQHMKHLAIGAEKLTLDLVQRAYGMVAKDCRVYNMYGPTEATIMAAVLDIDMEKEAFYRKLSSIPIGPPIANNRFLILDHQMNPVPLNVPGELYITGDSLTSGYLNNPKLTTEVFFRPQINADERRSDSNVAAKPLNKSFYQTFSKVWPPAGPPEAATSHDITLYRTGDLCRWLEDGTVEFIGRIDQQVKIRGFRIEPGEIENQLLEHEAVKEAFVMTRQYENGEAYLCAYIVPQPPAGAPSQRLRRNTPAGATTPLEAIPVFSQTLREFLSKRLPDYMVPSYFVEIDQMPLNPNRKIDAKALPAPDVTARSVKYLAPRDEVEEKLVAAWNDVLHLNTPVGIDDNFFESGGHSLKAARLLARIHKEFDVEIPITEIFSTSTVRGLANYIRRHEVSRYAIIQPAPVKEYYPLSPGQRRLYILQQMEDDTRSTVYNMTGVLDVEGKIDKQKFEKIFKQLIDRHESLRTSFHVIADQPVQKIHDPGEISFTIETDKQETAPHFFDLSKAPLLHVTLNPLADERYRLVIDMHHIISDGSSLAIFIEEFISLYKGETLPPLEIQYKDYTLWLLEQLANEAFKNQETYWLDRFAGEIPVLELPLDYPRPAVQDFAGQRVYFEIGESNATALQALAVRENVTLYMVMLAIFNIFCGRLSSQEDVIVGSPIIGRQQVECASVMGMFVNMLALRNYPACEKSFVDFLKELGQSTIAAFENQDVQFEELVGKLALVRDAGRNPLFDVAFAMQNIDIPQIQLPGLKLAPIDYDPGIAKFDLTFDCEILGDEVESGQPVDKDHSPGTLDSIHGLRIMVEYATSLFRPGTIENYIAIFKQILSSLLENNQVKIGDIDIVPEEQKRQVLYQFNDTGDTYPIDKTIHELFMEQAQRSPGQTAVVYKDQRLTYQELDEKTNRLAHSLIQQGLRPGDLAGIMVTRSLEMITGILGILKSGCGYVPMNPKAPLVRNRFLMSECDVEILLTAGDIFAQSNEPKEKLDGDIEPQVITINDINMIAGFDTTGTQPQEPAPGTRNQEAATPVETGPAGTGAGEHLEALSIPGVSRPSPGSIAYVIFTSGSTGQPKGVPITHSNFCPLIHWGYRHLGIQPGEKALQNLSYYFDWSVWEIFITLTTGATLYMADEDIILDPRASINFMENHGISILHITPTQFQYMIRQDRKMETLKYLFIGAEKLTYDLVERSFAAVGPECRLFNMYGPTEATIISAVLEIDRENYHQFKRLSSVPIGQPVANVDLLVLDKNKKLCPVNVPGELYIAGDGLARGYLKDPEKTAAVFIDNIYEKARIEGAKLYKTGDRVRWLSDGNIEFIGRIDYQVKIRGFRIEPGEIENRLLEHQAVKEAVVIDIERPDGEKYLCAYIVAGAKEDDLRSELREYLSKELPDYMVPSYFVFLDNIPLNPNAKVDRKALPLPEMT